ncbi:hypothetical protein [Tautonia sociabilis]|nr:hypothetical protein [Tautonia sociabilis]
MTDGEIGHFVSLLRQVARRVTADQIAELETTLRDRARELEAAGSR